MISVEGYKAFHGTMLIDWPHHEAEQITGDWLYKPDCLCWYCGGSSYPERVCTILVDLDENGFIDYGPIDGRESK